MKSQRQNGSAASSAQAGAAVRGSSLPIATESATADETEPRRRDRWYTTGEMARLSDNTLRTVRFYEEAGILRPVGRTEGGHRLFERSELDRLMLVSDMREAGLSLEEIRTLLETKQQASSGPEAARAAIDSLRKYMEDLKRKVDVLTRLHLDLSQTVETATRCLDCTHQESFPNHCRDCETIAGQKPYPRALRVLWALSTPSAERPKGMVEATPITAEKNGAAKAPVAVAKKRA